MQSRFWVPSAAATVTWSTTAKNAGVTLSGGNLIATATNASVGQSGRTNIGITTGGKKYWEVTMVDFTNDNAPGFGNSSMSTADDAFVGTNVNTVGYFNDPALVYNGATIFAAAPWTSGDTLCWAVDFNAGSFWVRVNSGNWNNSGTANPATNTGGAAVGVSGDIYPAYTVFAASASLGRATGAFSSFAFSVPSGFTGI